MIPRSALPEPAPSRLREWVFWTLWSLLFLGWLLFVES